MVLTIKNFKEVRGLLFRIRDKWYDIGVELYLDINELDIIRSQNGDAGTCLTEVIKKWLKSINPLPTWKALAKALKSEVLDEAGIAEEGVC